MRIRKAALRAYVLSLRLSVGMSILAGPAWTQEISKLDRERANDMLKVIGEDVRKHYYDSQFHGLNWDATLESYKQKINSATSFNMCLSHIAAALDALNDSHTFFLPPQHVVRTEYGFHYQFVGERCFVTRVRPHSDAEAKGIRPGDQILTINGYSLDRDTVHKMQYVFTVLRPQPSLRLGLQDPAGQQRTVDPASKMSQGKRVLDFTRTDGGGDFWDIIRQSENEEHLMRARYYEVGEPLIVLRVPEFLFFASEVDKMIEKAHQHANLIIDLRGNPGGSVETLKFLVGGLFDKEVKIADRAGRKESKPEVAKPRHNPFAGKIVVLVDSKSASASELFARVIQLEKRGVVLGDRSAGAVMESKHYSEQMGTETVIFYGASITEWDLIMVDGKSLEHTGVTPDEVVLPTAQDMANGRDPVIARAAELLGIKISPEVAGKMFPYEWPPEN